MPHKWQDHGPAGSINGEAKRVGAFRPFRYDRALSPEQIRLLSVDDSLESCVSVSLCTQSRRSAKYRALLYIWGSPLLNEAILCNGRELSITSYLHDLLLALHKDYAGQWLWFDAVCINQSDVQDKSVQDRRMSTTYRQAESVSVWLGKENDTTAVGLQLLANLCKAFPSDNGPDIRSLWLEDTSLIDLYEAEKFETLQKQDIPKDVTSVEWQAAARVLDSTWFTRIQICPQHRSEGALQLR